MVITSIQNARTLLAYSQTQQVSQMDFEINIIEVTTPMEIHKQFLKQLVQHQ